MSKRLTAIGAAALALALGCEEPAGNRTENQNEQGAKAGEQQARTDQHNQGIRDDEEANDRFDQAPQLQNRQGQAGQGQTGQGQMGQGQMGQGQMMGQPGAAQAGQVVTMESQSNFTQTLSRLTRGMRDNHLDVVSQIRYDRRERERAMRTMGQGQQQARGQTGTPGQATQQQGQVGDVRLIVFRRPDVESKMVETQGAQALLTAPRELLVFERGEQTVVAFRMPEQTAAVGNEEPTSEVLTRVVREATQGTRQPTAQRTSQQGQRATTSAGKQQGAQQGMTGQHQAQSGQTQRSHSQSGESQMQ